MSCHHEHSHGDPSDVNSAAPIPTNTSQSLRQYIDFPKLRGLNIAESDDKIALVFKSQEDKFNVEDTIESDSDCQMIINIPFTGYVKLFSIILRTHGDSNHCPKAIKIFKNTTDLDFDNGEAKKATYSIEQPLVGYLDEAEDESTLIEHYLPRNQFQSVTQLSLFIENNWADDEDEPTKIYYIEVRGQFQSPLFKDPVIALYESAANPSDHKAEIQQERNNFSSID